MVGPTAALGPALGSPGADGSHAPSRYSTVTVFARLRGWSTFSPRRRAIS